LQNTAVAGEPTWLEVQSEHFRVVTDAGEKNGRDAAAHFEQMRAAFGLLFGREKVNQKVPLQIIAFRNTKEFRQYSPLFRGKVIDLAGFFVPGQDKDFVVIDMSLPNSWETVTHEYAHVLLDSNYAATAPWYDEGFAEFFSSVKVNGMQVEVGAVIPGAGLLLQGRKLSLLDLLQVEHHSETYNQSGERRDMFYLESWLLVHYLFDTEQVTKAAKYFNLVNNQKVPIPAALQQAFGVTVEQLETTLLNYLKSDKIRILRYTFKQNVVTASAATVRPADPIEARIQLADLLLHEEDRVAQGIKELETIVAANPSQPEAQRALGYGYLRDRNFTKAAEHLQAAAALGSKDPRVYFFSAVVMYQQDPASVASSKAREYLKQAIELDPNYADAYAMLGLSQLNSGNYAEAEATLSRAIAIAPRDEMSRLNYAFALLNQQKIDQAKVAITYVTRSSNPQVAQQANDLLRQVKEYESHVAASTSDGAVHIQDATRVDLNRPLSSTPDVASDNPSPAPAAPPKMSYLKGTLLKVDCSAPPVATLTVSSAGKTWNLTTPNRDKTVLIGADKFSCSWSNLKVAINFTPTAAAEGKIVSLEIQ
jgi:Flp pilus assembly protein TadD